MTAPPEPLPGARLLFSLDPTYAHLNHGSFGSVPIGVQRAHQRLRDEMEANPMAFFTRGLFDRLDHVRRHLAAFLGADPEGTALVPNATTGIGIVLGSIRWEPGDEILLTDHGYGAVRLAAERLARRYGVVVREVPIPLAATEDAVVAAVAGAVTDRTRLAIVDQITSPTARQLPVARIAEAVRKQGVRLLVDAAHVPGLLPVDVTAIGADYWTGNFHKWAFAPRPTGVLVVAPEHRASIEAPVVSWQQEIGFPQAIEYTGTLDYTAWLAAPLGVYTLRTLGPEAVRAHNAALAEFGQRVVAEALGVADRLPPDPGPLPMRFIPLPTAEVHDHASAMALNARIAAELNCEVNVGYWRQQPYLRLSAQVYNRPDEYLRLAKSLPSLLPC